MKVFKSSGLEKLKPVPLIIIRSLLIIFVSTMGARSQDSESLSPAPGSYRLSSDSAQIRFPFEIFRGDIRFRCEVNGHEVDMLLDDGCMWDELLFWGGPEVKSLGLKYDGEVSIGGSADKEKQIDSKTASGISVKLPGVEFVDQSAIVASGGSGVSDMWAGSVGQVSAMFFKHFAVDINFDDMMITLIPKGGFQYEGNGTGIEWAPLKLGTWGIPATLSLPDGRRETLTLLMDLGYNDQLELRIKGEHNIILPDKVLPASLGMNIQGIETRGFMGRLPTANIGGYEINDLLVSYVSEEHSEHTISEAMIGLGLLSRFNLVFHYDSRRLYLEPNRRFNESFEYNMSGLTLRRGKSDYLDIIKVHPDSPGEEAGLKEGDKVTHVNDKPVHEIDFSELRSLLRRGGETINLKMLYKNGETAEIPLLLRRVI